MAAAGPEAVVTMLIAQAEQIASLRAEVEELSRRLGQSSANSSRPPSGDPPSVPGRGAGKGSGRKQGGQQGHPGSSRSMVADPDETVDHWPPACGGCGHEFAAGELVGDGSPVAHQVTDVRVLVTVCEHRLRRVRCGGCGKKTLAGLPTGVPAGAFSPAVAAAAATLASYRLSRRDTARLLEDLLGVELSPASVERLLKDASEAMEDPYVEILAAVDGSAVKWADETGWRNAGARQWLSVAAAERAALFQIDESRSREAAIALLGDEPEGTIVTDRYAAYGFVALERRQICLAHLLRDFKALSERPRQPGKLGRKLHAALGEVFEVASRPGRDPADLAALAAELAPLQDRIRTLLEQGTRSRDERTARFASGLLGLWPALWTFARVPGVTPTNNTAERALRHAVIWRKTSHGTQTDHGNRLVERLLSIRETCRLNAIHPHDYLTRLIDANLHDQPPPSPLRPVPT